MEAVADLHRPADDVRQPAEAAAGPRDEVEAVPADRLRSELPEVRKGAVPVPEKADDELSREGPTGRRPAGHGRS